jgi:carboxypeptidase family protein
MFRVRWTLGLVALSLLPAAAAAQVTTADIIGRVTDASGGVLPGATVTIENVGTRDVRTASTNATGDYVFNLLPIGTYTVKIELQGFNAVTSRAVLAAGDRARVDAKLSVGTMTENISVVAESPLVQTDTSTLSALVTEKAVQDLPVNGRNFVRLVQLVPGANEGTPNSLASGTRPDDRRQSSAISVNGALDNQNNQLIDGVDNNERAIGTIGVKPSIDAIAEVKVQTNLYTAETGRTAGGVVNIITKSGSNIFHGSLFEFYRNDKFDSRNYFSTTKPLLHQNQYGGSLGGPLKSNKTFFFGDYEGFGQQQGVTNLITVPTMKMRSGDFSELTTPIYDPLATPRTAFQGNVIPSNRLDPIALRFMSLYPTPTSGGLANNYGSTTIRTQDSDTADVRLDHRLDDNDSLFARYSYNNVNTFTPAACPAIADGVQPGCGGGLAFPGSNVTKAHGVQANFVRILSPSLISEIKAGYLHLTIDSLPLNYGKNLSQVFGLPGVNFDEVTSGLSTMTVTGFAALGDAQFIPLLQVDRTWQLNGSVTKTAGSHNVKIGTGVVFRNFTVFQSQSPVGNFTFDTRLTDNGAGVGGNAVASMLLGYPSTVARNHTLFYPYYHTNEPNAFVQDDWRATSWLTLNLGVRYDIFTPYTEEHGNLSNLDLTTFKVLLPGQNGVSDSANVKTDYSNVAPRLGFSATLPASIVVRGGYGLAYFPGNYMSQSFLKNPPYTSSYAPPTSTGASGGLPTLRLGDGLPAPVATDAVNLSGSFIAVDQDFKSTKVEQFNAIVEKEFSGNVVSAGYVGARYAKLAVAIGNIDLAPVGPGAIQQRRTYYAQLPNVTSIGVFRSAFEQDYNALQLVFQRRHRSGLTLGSNYTLAHNTQTSPSPWDVNVIERFDAGNDVRHRYVLTANYELPFGQSLTGAGRQLLAGWQVNAIASFQTGLPYDITNSTARTNTGGTDRPNLVGDATLDNPTVGQWFNTSAFAAQTANTLGTNTVPRNYLHGPNQKRLDLSFFKDVAFTATAKMQLRFEIYNLTNTPIFANPNGALGNAAFGTISSTQAGTTPRQMQFAVKLLF